MPVRIELGPRDIENGVCILVRRDNQEKLTVKLNEINTKLEEVLESIQTSMFEECKKRLINKTTISTNMDEFVSNINKNQGFIKAMWCGDETCENTIKEQTGAHSRCIPFKSEAVSDTCVVCGKPAKHFVIWGRQY